MKIKTGVKEEGDDVCFYLINIDKKLKTGYICSDFPQDFLIFRTTINFSKRRFQKLFREKIQEVFID